MLRCSRKHLFLALFGGLLPATAAAQQGLSVEQALAVHEVRTPVLGDDFVAFQLLVPRPVSEGPGGARLHIGVLDGLGELRDGGRRTVRWLVDGNRSAAALAVRPNAREVSYLARVEDRLQVVVQSIDGGEAVPFARTPSVAAYRWRPDGQAIAFTALDPLPPLRQQAVELGIRPVVVDEDFQHLSLWVVERGGEPRRLTEDCTVFGFEWAPDGTRLACAIAPRNLVDDGYVFQDLYVVDAANGAQTLLVDLPGKLGLFVWSPDGTRVAYVTAADRNDPHAGAPAIVDVGSGAIDVRRLPLMANSLHWWGDGADAELLANVSLGARSSFLRVVANATPREGVPFLAGRTVVDAVDVRGEWLAFAASTPSHPSELFVHRIDDAARGVAADALRVTDSNPWLVDVALGEQTVERVRARDGLEIEGVLIKPLGYREGTRYPFVIVVHGGPEAHFSDGWLTGYANWGQLLAARGYVSWYPNYRSSTGYGAAFCKHDHGDPMGKEFEDHLDAIAHFDTRGLVDPERVGIGGGSYGGYTAAWAATRHSERFAAAVSFVPFTDIRSKWLTSDIPWEFYFVHYQERWPWQQPGLLADRSPLTWAAQCRTPLLLLGGTEDTRVHPSQPFMLYRAVKFATDTPVRYVQYPGEGHGNRSNVYRLDYALRALRWFDHYLAGDDDRRTMAPPPLDLEYPR